MHYINIFKLNWSIARGNCNKNLRFVKASWFRGDIIAIDIQLGPRQPSRYINLCGCNRERKRTEGKKEAYQRARNKTREDWSIKRGKERREEGEKERETAAKVVRRTFARRGCRALQKETSRTRHLTTTPGRIRRHRRRRRRRRRHRRPRRPFSEGSFPPHRDHEESTVG